MKLISIGFGNMIVRSRLVAIISPLSAPGKRTIQEARERGVLLDGTFGRKTRSILILDDGHIVLSAVQPDTIAQRFETGTESDSVDDAL